MKTKTPLLALGFLALNLASPLLTPHLAQAQGTSTQVALSNYQRALDEISHNNLENARVLCDDGIRANGQSPELNLLLAYILERQGKNEQAWDAADAVSNQSPLAGEFAAQLQTNLPVANGRAVAARNTRAANNSSARAQNKTATRVAQTDARLQRLENLLLGYVNEVRRKNGLGALTMNATLSDIARAHSAEMRDKNYFEHESPTPGLEGPLERYKAVVKTTPRLIAENIFRSWGSRHEIVDTDALKAHNSLMNSPGHRSNILLPSVTQIGIGYITNANGDLWVTQMFLKP